MAAGTILKVGAAGALLPLPDALSYQSEYKWETVELGAAGFALDSWNGDVMESLGEIAGDIGKQMERAFAQGNSAIANTYNHIKQQAPNPKEAINFKGVSFREYSLDFMITADNAGEIKEKANFINQLHREAAPELSSNKFFWKYPPSGFIVMYNSGGMIFSPREIYIKSLGVDLNPGGDTFYPTYAGGVPVMMKLSVGLIEKALPSKDNDSNLLEFA